MTINPELRDLIPPLSRDELAALEASLKEHGCITPIVVWHVKPDACDCEWVDDCNGTEFRLEAYRLTESDVTSTEWHCTTCGNANTQADEVIIDGHNRFAICERLGIGCFTHRMYFDSIEAVKIWMIRNQFARRNLQPMQRTELALKLEPLIAAQAKANQSAAGGALLMKSSKALSEPKHTRADLAEAAGVSEDTIRKAKVIIEKADEQTKSDLRAGKTKINTVYKQIKEKEKADAKPIDGKPNDPKDKIGQPIPKELLTVFTTGRFGDLKAHFDGIRATIRILLNENAGFHVNKHVSATEKYLIPGLDSIRYQLIDDGEPYCVCIICNGTGKVRIDACKSCKGCGWLTKYKWKQIKDDAEAEASIRK